MLYRVRIDLAFISDDPPHDIIDKALDYYLNGITINPHTLYQERGYITLEECYHDEDPNKPCVILERYETPLTPL